MRETIDVQNEEFRLIDYGSLLDQIVLFALSAEIALDLSFGLKFETFVMPEAINIGVLTSLLFPRLSTGLTNKFSLIFYFE